MKVTEHFDSIEWTSHYGIPYPVDRVDMEEDRGGTWLVRRLRPLCETLEVIRYAAGDQPIALTPHGGYRTEADQAGIIAAHPEDAQACLVAGAKTSQHPKGRAADIQHGSLTARELHALILSLYRHDRLPYLGGLGLYPTFVHCDVRKRDTGGLAQWGGLRRSNVG